LCLLWFNKTYVFAVRNTTMPNYSKTISPALLWLAIVALSGTEFRQNQWECLLIMFAALELVPRGLRLLGLPPEDWYAFAPIGLCAAYFFSNYWYLALPYLIWAVWLTLKEAALLLALKKIQILDFVRVFALGYWTTGAMFVVFYLAGFSPLGFDPVIVSLTGAHFHVAGFVLAVMVYCLMRERPGTLTRTLGWATLLGMPLVAAGITGSQLGLPNILEQVSALGFVAFVLVVIWQQVDLSFQIKYSKTARYLWLAGAVCLLMGATLAGVYALRFQFPIQWVSIPNMKIWHGTLNTLGFAWLSLIAWEATIEL